MLDKDQLYADYVLVRWGAWVRTEQIRLDCRRGGPSRPPVIDDELGLRIDQAIARTGHATQQVTNACTSNKTFPSPRSYWRHT